MWLILGKKCVSLHLEQHIMQTMKVNLETFDELKTPCYVLEEKLLRRNLELIRRVAGRRGAG